jgi:hypothetical protein
MKTLNRNTTTTLALALIIGSATLSHAGNIPSVTYPQGALATSNGSVQMTENTPWHKGISYASGIVTTGAWYRICPVSHMILNSKHEAEVTLSNGKKIMLAWAGLKDTVEANLGKYAAYMYGGQAEVDTSASYAQASLGSGPVVR